MNHADFKGNTLSEYALLIGLIALISLAALKLLGNSVASSYEPLSNGVASRTLQQMSQLDFKSPVPHQHVPTTASTNGLSLQFTTRNGGGVNATSIEGVKNTPTGKALGAANQLQGLMTQVTDPALKAALLAASESVLKLSASQALVEVRQNLDQTGIMSQLVAAAGLSAVHLKDAVNSVGLYQKDIEEKMNALANLPTSNQAELHQAYQLLSEVANSNWDQYRDLINATDTTGARFHEPEISQFKIVSNTALQTGALSQTPALETSVSTGITLSNP